MPRYLLFHGMNYYPSGGANDYAGALHDLEAACARGKEMTVDAGLAWWNVLDVEESKIVAKGEQHAGGRNYGEYVYSEERA